VHALHSRPSKVEAHMRWAGASACLPIVLLSKNHSLPPPLNIPAHPHSIHCLPLMQSSSLAEQSLFKLMQCSLVALTSQPGSRQVEKMTSAFKVPQGWDLNATPRSLLEPPQSPLEFLCGPSPL